MASKRGGWAWDLLAWIGGIHLLLFVLGSLDVIDFHTCVGRVGSCHIKLDVQDGEKVMRMKIGGNNDDVSAVDSDTGSRGRGTTPTPADAGRVVHAEAAGAIPASHQPESRRDES